MEWVGVEGREGEWVGVEEVVGGVGRSKGGGRWSGCIRGGLEVE